MKKLSLSVADLKVHSFPTEGPRGGAGTVYGAADTTPACPPKTSLWTCVTTGEAVLYDTPRTTPECPVQTAQFTCVPTGEVQWA